ncbi:7958_t:CDS:2, partial [Dentiscutata erythropus]
MKQLTLKKHIHNKETQKKRILPNILVEKDGKLIINPSYYKNDFTCSPNSNKLELERSVKKLHTMAESNIDFKHISIYISLASISGGPEIYVKLYWMNEFEATFIKRIVPPKHSYTFAWQYHLTLDSQ